MGVLRISISVSAGFTRLIAVGVFRRVFRRAKALWLPKGRGRPSVGEDVVELILDMKRSNWSWGALRISQELLLLGIIKSGSTLNQTAVTWQLKKRRCPGTSCLRVL